MLSQHLKIYNREQVLSFTKVRRFETRIGEVIQTLEDTNNLEVAIQQNNARFVIVGVPEDIGVKANYGSGGAQGAWNSFLSHFLNIQSNDFFEGSNMLLLGHLNFAGVGEVIESNAGSADERIEAFRHGVNAIDDAVEHVVKMITAAKKIPVVVSGGHNNAYGCIKGAAKGLYKVGILPIAQINAVNLDAHAEFGPMEGRHSGNAFRYADEDGYLEKYCVVGLHENHLPQNCWLDIANNPFFDFITYEDIFLHNKQSFTDAVQHAVTFTNDTVCGIEVDLDVINSGSAVSGISLLQARQFIQLTASQAHCAYLHVTEGWDRNAAHYDFDASGKIISYLVSDFVKALNT